MGLVWASGAQQYLLHQPCQGGVVTSTAASSFSQMASVFFFFSSQKPRWRFSNSLLNLWYSTSSARRGLFLTGLLYLGK